MDNELLKIFSDELREIRYMTAETRRMADAAVKNADAAMKRADASWELVIITRNQFREDLQKVKLPWWRKIWGIAA